MKNKKQLNPAKEQLIQEPKAEVFQSELTQPKQTKNRKRNKKKVDQTIKEVASEPKCVEITLTKKVSKQNWIVRTWNKFIVWLNE